MALYYVRGTATLVLIIAMAQLQISPTCAVFDSNTIMKQLSLLEVKSEQQEREISFMKTKNKEQDDKIQQLEVQNYQFHELVDQMTQKMAALEDCSKRETSLAKESVTQRRSERSSDDDAHNFDQSENTEVVEKSNVIKWPSSCKDLSSIGHSLNGFYLVKDNRNEPTKIQTVYCNFEKSAAVDEKRIGSVDIKSSTSGGVHFYVQKLAAPLPTTKSGFNFLSGPSAGVVRFKSEQLNVGRGMDKTTGVFKAPKTGIYQFMFFALKNGFDINPLEVKLRLNGVQVESCFTNFGMGNHPIMIHSTLKLNSGDKVDIYREKGVLDDNTIYFSGSILEEDIVFPY